MVPELQLDSFWTIPSQSLLLPMKAVLESGLRQYLAPPPAAAGDPE
jgi:hypothetical protein